MRCHGTNTWDLCPFNSHVICLFYSFGVGRKTLGLVPAKIILVPAQGLAVSELSHCWENSIILSSLIIFNVLDLAPWWILFPWSRHFIVREDSFPNWSHPMMHCSIFTCSFLLFLPRFFDMFCFPLDQRLLSISFQRGSFTLSFKSLCSSFAPHLSPAAGVESRKKWGHDEPLLSFKFTLLSFVTHKHTCTCTFFMLLPDPVPLNCAL